jgi:hypothetical protein
MQQTDEARPDSVVTSAPEGLRYGVTSWDAQIWDVQSLLRGLFGALYRRWSRCLFGQTRLPLTSTGMRIGMDILLGTIALPGTI